MQDLKISIREVNQNDSEYIFEWRNDSESRSMFIHSGEVTYDEHNNWLLKSIENPLRKLFIGEIEQDKVGIIRFDINKQKSKAEISINTNPAMRGKGLGKKLLIEAINNFQIDNENKLFARIKKSNIASIKIFEHAGFKIINKEQDIILLEKLPSNIYFKKVSVNDSKILFRLLKKRVHFISHRSNPAYEKHKKFIESKPYRHWYLIFEDDEPIGSFYIQHDNSIGINLTMTNLNNVKATLDFIRVEFEPMAADASKTPSYFYVNVAYSNIQFKDILAKLDCIPIQTSYQLY
jgi:RimJ/RimL family protein N-acetyltransferase